MSGSIKRDGAIKQSCTAPGHWLIEGYTVSRFSARGWKTERFGDVVHSGGSFADQRAWIADQIEQSS